MCKKKEIQKEKEKREIWSLKEYGGGYPRGRTRKEKNRDSEREREGKRYLLMSNRMLDMI